MVISNRLHPLWLSVVALAGVVIGQAWAQSAGITDDGPSEMIGDDLERALLGGPITIGKTNACRAFLSYDEDSATTLLTDTPLTPEELAQCQAMGRLAGGAAGFQEVPLKSSGLVLAGLAGASGGNGAFNVELRELFLAAAVLVPEDDGCTLVPNPYSNWSEISDGLPERAIRLYGPSPADAVRTAFVERALIEGARQIDCLAELERRDPEAFARAILPRRDEVWLSDWSSQETLFDVLYRDPAGVGLLDWQSFQATRGLIPNALGGVVPRETTLRSGQYPLTLPRYLYIDAEKAREPSAIRTLRGVSTDPSGRRTRTYSTSGTSQNAVSKEVELPSGRRVRRYSTDE